MGDSDEVLSKQEVTTANMWLVRFMKGVLEDGKAEVAKLQYGLRRTYWIIIVLSIVMFSVGIGLILTAVVKAWGDSELWQSLSIGGLGLADLTGLYFFRPIEQIRKIMADMSQLTIAINSYQTQVSLRLLQADSENRRTIGQAADHIRRAAQSGMRSIQKYFEDGESIPPPPKPDEPESEAEVPQPENSQVSEEDNPAPTPEDKPTDAESRELKLAKDIMEYLDTRLRERAAQPTNQPDGKPKEDES